MNPTDEPAGKRALDQVHEQLIVLRCQAGDEQAFVELMAKYHRRLLFYVRRLLPPNSDEEALLQEVWLSVYRQLPKLREAGAFRAWLYRLARDRALVELRRKRIPFAALTEVLVVSEEEPEFGPEGAQHVHRGLDQLSREHRDVLMLRSLEDMSYEEIAWVTGPTNCLWPLRSTAVTVSMFTKPPSTSAVRGVLPPQSAQASAAVARCRLLHSSRERPRSRVSEHPRRTAR